VRVICWVLGHRYRKVKDFGSQTRMVACARCRNRWLMNDPTESLLPWDDECEEIARMSMEVWP
jgi:hypothetical protein